MIFGFLKSSPSYVNFVSRVFFSSNHQQRGEKKDGQSTYSYTIIINNNVENKQTKF